MMMMTKNPEYIATEDLAIAKSTVAISSAHHHHHQHHHHQHQQQQKSVVCDSLFPGVTGGAAISQIPGKWCFDDAHGTSQNTLYPHHIMIKYYD